MKSTIYFSTVSTVTVSGSLKSEEYGILFYMLAIDRRMCDIPLEERLQGRTSDIAAWNKTMQPTISISEAQKQLCTGHQDIRTFWQGSARAEHERNARYREHNVRQYCHRQHRIPTNHNSTATSTDKNPARYDFNQQSPTSISRHPQTFSLELQLRNNNARDANCHERNDNYDR
jgi:hypothetical protein